MRLSVFGQYLLVRLVPRRGFIRFEETEISLIMRHFFHLSPILAVFVLKCMLTP